MEKVKKLIKSVFGVYLIHILKENYHRILNTNYFRLQCEYNTKSLNFYSTFINKNDLVFDVGANFGNRVETFLKLKAKVIAIEPQKPCCKYLRRKYREDIILIEKAVGEKKETKKMFISNNSAISSFSETWIDSVKKNRYKEENWNKVEMIEQVTIDEIIQKYGDPEFIKIDVEGYELEVLKGLNRPVKMVSFEYTIPEQTEKAINCIMHLKKINNLIECNYSKGESMKF
jgi:FkbM family methyltransferase